MAPGSYIIIGSGFLPDLLDSISGTGGAAVVACCARELEQVQEQDSAVAAQEELPDASVPVSEGAYGKKEL